MLSIRLTRTGKKKAPQYRVVVMPKHRDPWADHVEILGHYNPRSTDKTIVLKEDRIKYWIEKGAEVSDTVWNLLVANNVVEGKKRSATHISKKRSAKIDEKKAEAAEKQREAEEAAKAAEEAAKAEAEAKAAEEAAAAEAPTETPEETPAEESPVEAPSEEEAPAEETKPETDEASA